MASAAPHDVMSAEYSSKRAGSGGPCFCAMLRVSLLQTFGDVFRHSERLEHRPRRILRKRDAASAALLQFELR